MSHVIDRETRSLIIKTFSRILEKALPLRASFELVQSRLAFFPDSDRPPELRLSIQCKIPLVLSPSEQLFQNIFSGVATDERDSLSPAAGPRPKGPDADHRPA